MNKLFSLILLLCMCFLCSDANAQQEEQNVRGLVRDAMTHEPVAYATIVLTDVPSHKTITDSIGKFTLRSVPVGRHSLRCQNVGYETVVMNELLVTAGKETYVEVVMNENQYELQGIEVRPALSKQNALNNMVLTGGRMFSVEETSRYAGGFDDPARLATSFASVASGGTTNGISIHGNVPHLLECRLVWNGRACQQEPRIYKKPSSDAHFQL